METNLNLLTSIWRRLTRIVTPALCSQSSTETISTNNNNIFRELEHENVGSDRILNIYRIASSEYANGDIETFWDVVQKPFEKTFLSLLNHKTLLQTACGNRNVQIATEIVLIILQTSYFNKMENKEKVNQIINFQSETTGLTALHISILRDNSEVAMMLIRRGADITLPCYNGVNPMQLMLSRMPIVISKIYDENMSKEDPEAETSSDNLKLRLDYRPICGVPWSKDNDPAPETAILFETLRESTEETRLNILAHPLAYMFVLDKWEKMNSIITALALINLAWCALFVFLITEIYLYACPHQGENNTCQPLSSRTLYLGYHFKVVSLFLGVKATFSVIQLPLDRQHYVFHFLHRLENLIYWTALILSAGLITRLFSIERQQSSQPVQCPSWEYVFAIAGVLVASFLMMWQTKKIPYLESIPVYTEVFVKVSKRVLFFITGHLLIILGFCFVFQIMMPNREEFKFGNGSFFKVFTMLTTGEINYNELFFSNETESLIPSPTTTKVAFSAFQIFMNMVFNGIVNGIAVNNCKELLDHGEMLNMSYKLEEMYLLEKILPIKLLKKLCPNWLENNVLITSPQTFTIKQINDIPKNIRLQARAILDHRHKA